MVRNFTKKIENFSLKKSEPANAYKKYNRASKPHLHAH